MIGCPRVTDWNLTPTSAACDNYNCLAWAIHQSPPGFPDLPVWPDPTNNCSWPPDMARVETVDAIRAFLKRVGFEDCAHTFDVEPGWEKAAIYGNDFGPQHVARQLPDGAWTSKMGTLVDATHQTLHVLEGGVLGNVQAMMRRPRNQRFPLPPLFPPRPILVTVSGAPLLR
jgi:hypothetical protein